jgi:hypothetical protein
MKLRLTLALTAASTLALAAPALAAPADSVRAAPVTVNTPHVITINKTHFSLSLWKRDPGHSRGYRLERRWKVAVGMKGHATPTGVYRISRKALNPSWTPPDSSWVPVNQRGKFFEGDDPQNPIAAAFLSISDKEGLGIHGTTNRPSLGHRASHGCIRMTVPAVKSLYARAEIGTPVIIAR